jgi:oligopeptide/dipeptide ABC transporter ATP-binding protein
MRSNGMRDETLSVTDLHTYFMSERGLGKAVSGVSFRLSPGEVLGLVGESGSGKTVTALSLIRLLPPSARVFSGSVVFSGEDLLPLPEHRMREIRGKEMGMIFQEPMSSLDPVFTIGQQMVEALFMKRGLSKKKAVDEAFRYLSAAGIAQARRVFSSYPYELSRGMCQRAMIALALSLEPKLLIADEPTTALDVTIQAGIIERLHRLITDFSLSLIFISHDLALVSEIASRVLVIYGGWMMEKGKATDILNRPLHPYSRALSAAELSLDRALPRPLPGSLPDIFDKSEGCIFSPRCPEADERCQKEVPQYRKAGERMVRCFKVGA